jgi:outer membrane receptor for ferrienterochelin and colicins
MTRISGILGAAALLTAVMRTAVASPYEGLSTGNRRVGPDGNGVERVIEVSPDETEERGATRLDTVLGAIPGFVLSSASGLGTTAVVDGMPGTQITVLFDGRPVARPNNTRSGPVIDLASILIDPDDIARVEVYRGTGPAGSGDLGGIVVNIVTRRPDDDALEANARLRAGGVPGRWQSQTAGLGISSPLGEHVVLQLDGGFDRTSPLDVNGDATADLPHRQLWSVDGDLRWSPHRNESLRLAVSTRAVETVRQTWTDSALAEQIENDIDSLNGRFDDTTDYLAVQADINGDWRSDRGVRVRHDSMVRHQAYDFDKLRLRDAAVVPQHTTDDLGLRQAVLVSAFVDEHTIEPEFVARANHTVRQEFDETGPADAIDAWLVAAGVGLTELWSVTESFDLSVRGYGEVSNLFGPGGVVGVRGRLTVSDPVTLRVSLSRTRRTPEPEELFFRFDHSEVGYAIEGNAELRPEHLEAARAGATFDAGPVVVEVDAYAQRLQHAISVDHVGSDTSAVGHFQYANVGLVRSAGLNTVVNADIAPWLRLTASHSWLPYSDVADSGDRLAMTAFHSVASRITATAFEDRLDLWSVFDFRTALTVPAGSPAAPSAPTLGLGAAWEFDHGLRVQLDAQNLSNTIDPTWGPKPGRSIFLSLSWHLESSS